MKFVHAADLHIDSPLRGLERYEGAPVDRVRGATRAAFRNVIDLCVREEASFLVLAGDVFDGDWKDVGTGLFFVNELRRLRDVSCRVVLLRGNHDFELTRALDYPDHVHELPAPGRGAPSFVFEREGVAFHGLSYATQNVKDNLVPAYPAPRASLLNVGVLHTNATGSTEHQAYAPCTVSELIGKGYQYWALGHVHGHAILHEDPWVVYPGNTQGRNVRETGHKGCVLVESDDVRIASVRFVDTSIMRWFSEVVQLDEADDRDALLAKVRVTLDDVAVRAGGQLAAVRLEVRGNCAAHAEVVSDREQLVAQIRADALDRSEILWLEKVTLATTPAVPLEELRASRGLVADLLRYTERLRTEVDGEAQLARLSEGLGPLRKKMAHELEALGLDTRDPRWLAHVLAEAEALLAQRLAGGGRE